LSSRPRCPRATWRRWSPWRARPGRVTFAHIGQGTSHHIGGELLAQLAGVEMTGVAYSDAGAQLPDVPQGRVTFSFASVVTALPRMREGSLRGLAVSGTAMGEADVRARLADLGVDLEVSDPEAYRDLIQREIPRMAASCGVPASGRREEIMAIGGLDHSTIRSVDLEATRAFYVDMLGREEGPRPPLGFPGSWLYSVGMPTVHLVGPRVEEAGKP
jgi:hypothetical protein